VAISSWRSVFVLLIYGMLIFILFAVLGIGEV